VRTLILSLCLVATAAYASAAAEPPASRIIVASRWGDLSNG
jgi:hypothetical protein